MAQLTKQHRETLIRKVAQESKVTLEAVARLSDEVLLKMTTPEGMQFLADFKPAITYNRYKQGLKTAEANRKAKELKQQLLDFEKSPVLNLGKRIWNALHETETSAERDTELQKDNLVHEEKYEDTRKKAKLAIEEARQLAQENVEQVVDIEKRILAIEEARQLEQENVEQADASRRNI